jgi:hypothetical protein
MLLFNKLIIYFTLNSYRVSGGGRGRLAGTRAPARKFFPTSLFVKYFKF